MTSFRSAVCLAALRGIQVSRNSGARVFRDVGLALCKPRRWPLSWRSHIAVATLGHRALRWLRRTAQAKGRCRPST
jgi:hypothetical protein